MTSRLLTVAEVADRLGVSTRTVQRLTAALRVVRIGRCLRIDAADLDDYISQNKREPWDASTSAPVTARGGARGPTRTAGTDAKASTPLTEPSPANDSERPSWLRPLRRVGARNG